MRNRNFLTVFTIRFILKVYVFVNSVQMQHAVVPDDPEHDGEILVLGG